MTFQIKNIGHGVYIVITDEFGEQHTIMLTRESALKISKILQYSASISPKTYEHIYSF